MKKLNIIDYLVIIVLVAAIALIAYTFLKPEASENSAAEGLGLTALPDANCRFTVLCSDLNPELAQNLIEIYNGESRIADGVAISPKRIYNSERFLNGQITDIEIVDEVQSPDGTKTVSLLVTVEATVDLSAPSRMLGYQLVCVGSSYNVKTIDLYVEGTIIDVETLA